MKKLLLSVFATVMMVVGLTGVASVSPAYADGAMDQSSLKPGDEVSGASGNMNKGLVDVLNSVITVIVGALGFVAVAMVVVGGVTYATSQGDATKTKKAMNTILYGIVGVIVAMLAYAIVNFILGNVF